MSTFFEIVKFEDIFGLNFSVTKNLQMASHHCKYRNKLCLNRYNVLK